MYTTAVSCWCGSKLVSILIPEDFRLQDLVASGFVCLNPVGFDGDLYGTL